MRFVYVDPDGRHWLPSNPGCLPHMLRVVDTRNQQLADMGIAGCWHVEEVAE